jgi:hypothetical protein
LGFWAVLCWLGGFGCWRARWGFGVELCEGAAERVEARGAGESVLLDGAADGGGYCGVFFVGEIDVGMALSGIFIAWIARLGSFFCASFLIQSLNYGENLFLGLRFDGLDLPARMKLDAELATWFSLQPGNQNMRD